MTSHPLRDFERAVIYWLLLPMVRDFGIRLLSLLSGNLVYLNMVLVIASILSFLSVMHLFFGCRRSGSEVKHRRPQVEAADLRIQNTFG